MTALRLAPRSRPPAQVILALALPTLVFIGVGALMGRLTGRTAALARRTIASRPLNQRLRYAVVDVTEFWGSFDSKGLEAERRFLELDLWFPAIYGGAIVLSALFLIRRTRRSWPAIASVIFTGLTALGDVTENVVQLRELRLYRLDGTSALEDGWIRLASAATATKLVSGSLAFLMLLIAAGVAWYRWQNAEPSPAPETEA